MSTWTKLNQSDYFGPERSGIVWPGASVFLDKFKSKTQIVLLAYEFDPKTRHLLLLGSHENFSRELKR
jgi:hypothetical protein